MLRKICILYLTLIFLELQYPFLWVSTALGASKHSVFRSKFAKKGFIVWMASGFLAQQDRMAPTKACISRMVPALLCFSAAAYVPQASIAHGIRLLYTRSRVLLGHMEDSRVSQMPAVLPYALSEATARRRLTSPYHVQVA